MRLFSGLRKKAEGMTLANKLILAISASTVSVLLIVSIFNYTRTINIITEHQSASSLELLELKKQNFIAYFNQLGDYSLALRNDESFVRIIGSTEIGDYTNILYIKSLLRNMYYSRKDITELKLYLVNSRYAYTISRRQPNIKTEEGRSPDLPDTKDLEEGNYMYVMPPANAPEDTLKIWRTIINISDKKPLAYVEITVDDSFLSNLADIKETGDLFLLLDTRGRLYYANDNIILNDKIPASLTGYTNNQKNGNFIYEINDESYLAIYSRIDNTDFVLFNMIPTNRIDSAVVETRNISLIIAFAALIISLGLILLLIKTLLKPLGVLAEQMKIVGGGNFKVRIKVGGSAEISNLGTQFNSMISRVDELIEKNYVAELNEKMARLQALEAQINPHFLNNTLQAISAQAIMKKQRGISKMIEALASMLRYSITEGDSMLLSAEIKHVQSYLMLQKARFDERLDYNIKMDESLSDFLIPKISILTLVENSVNHGLEQSPERICINIDILLDKGYLVIKVVDDGCGMSPEKLTEIRRQLEYENGMTGSIGLKNLAGRLHILYNGMAKMEIDSTPGKGTVVILYIPLNN
ncbi:MAG: sensor histidine kinase [Clostridiaceae bacterium]|jgi:two-component system sensor histidine kinase YesM|nr:sensor histidine kinase [Clostridiaceae bacterium]